MGSEGLLDDFILIDGAEGDFPISGDAVDLVTFSSEVKVEFFIIVGVAERYGVGSPSSPETDRTPKLPLFNISIVSDSERNFFCVCLET